MVGDEKRCNKRTTFSGFMLRDDTERYFVMIKKARKNRESYGIMHCGSLALAAVPTLKSLEK